MERSHGREQEGVENENCPLGPNRSFHSKQLRAAPFISQYQSELNSFGSYIFPIAIKSLDSSPPPHSSSLLKRKDLPQSAILMTIVI
jgi:hypothetical protein